MFCDNKASVDDMISAGAVVSLDNGSPADSLRCRRFCEKVSMRATFVQVHTLPPTSAALKYHSMRVFLQVQQWLDADCEQNAEDWGWYLFEDFLHPHQTDRPPAPDALLHSIRCNCRTDCDSKRCSCKKHGLTCSVACGHCRGVSCANSPAPSLSDLTEDLSDVRELD